MTAVAMSHSGRMLFSGTANGQLRSWKYPLTQPGDWTEMQGHASAISKMKITYDDQVRGGGVARGGVRFPVSEV
jgi:hypothetical protein